MLIRNNQIVTTTETRDSFSWLSNEQYTAIVDKINSILAVKWKQGQSFCVYEVVGKDWSGTPFQALYDVVANSNRFADPYAKSANDMGYLFKKVVSESKYIFKFEKTWISKYQVTQYVPYNPLLMP